jgi:anti-sigma factor RsiW
MSTPAPICSELQAALLDLVDAAEPGGALSGPERARLERHAAACRRCAGEVRTYRRTVQLLRELSPRRLAAITSLRAARSP